LDERDEPAGHASIGADQPWKALRKNFVRTGWRRTDEFAYGEHQKHIAASTGQIGDRSLIAPMNAHRGLVALWTGHTWSMTRYANDEFSGTGMNGSDHDSSGKVQNGRQQGCLFGFHEEKTPER
jgi:hypothetical protein